VLPCYLQLHEKVVTFEGADQFSESVAVPADALATEVQVSPDRNLSPPERKISLLACREHRIRSAASTCMQPAFLDTDVTSKRIRRKAFSSLFDLGSKNGCTVDTSARGQFTERHDLLRSGLFPFPPGFASDLSC
jgi:hypothetical protein